MNNNASGERFPVLAAIPLAKLLFGIVVSEDDLLETARLVLRQTRNAATQTCILRNVPIEDCHVKLPHDVFEIKAVMQGSPFAPSPVPLSVHMTLGHENPEQLDVPALIQHEYLNDSDEYSLRNLNKHQTIDFNFHFENKELSFRQKSGTVNVIYTVRPVGCDGIEEVPEAVIEAIAYYLNFIHVQKRFFRGQEPQTLMQFALTQKDLKVAQARAGGRISDNAKKKILDAMHSMDRHQYGAPRRR